MSAPSHPTRLRLEHLPAGQACGVPHPRLSWWLPEGASQQLAYEVEVTAGTTTGAEVLVWGSGRVESSGHVLVPALLQCPAPAAGEHRRVRVRVWTDQGTSPWSTALPWVTGLLEAADLTAQWIMPAETVPSPAGQRPAYALRHEFHLSRPVREARLLVTAHGIYEAFLNGHRVGDQELTPGFTAYRRNLQVQHFDVTELLQSGENAVGVVVSDGWFRGRHGFERRAEGFGDRTAALAQLHITYSDGTRQRLGTGPGWRSTVSDISAADLMDGQTEQPRLHPSWLRPGFDDTDWEPVAPASGDLIDDRNRLTTSVAPPVRQIREIAPVSITHLPSGAWVVDFGENLNGWVRLSALGPAGTTLTLTHGESLQQGGEVTTEHLRAFDFATKELLPAGQVDSVTSTGSPDQVFEPRHTTHGFRYVQIDGGLELVRAEDIRAVVVHTDLEERGSFACSDDRLNRLHEIAVRSFLTNACDIPTDCPQRERSGFTGDWQIYLETAAFTHDVAGFTDKWLRDLAADQWANGIVPNIVPNPAGAGPSGHHFADIANGSAGWGDAAVIVPWQIWRLYGDREMLARQYPSMTAWVDYAVTQAATRRHPDRAAAHPQPRAHETYLWDTGFHWGEWLEPGEIPAPDPDKDHGIVATAYLVYSAGLLAEIAAELGHISDAAHYRAVAEGAKAAWCTEYLDEQGQLSVPTQANHVRALAFDLVPDRLRQSVADRLSEMVVVNGDRLGTGFLATGMLLPTLADNDHLETAYRVLFSTGVPSWMEMLERGATTVWEWWDGITDDGHAQASLNHYSKGAVISFLHQIVAGIRPAETTSGDTTGYRRFVFAPRPGGGLTWATAEHTSPYGTIHSRWELIDDQVELDLTVPAGTTAELHLRDRHLELGSGHHLLTVPAVDLIPTSSLARVP